MSQLPQNNEAFDNSPEYAKLYQGNDSQPSDADDADELPQRASEQPFDVQREQAGEKAANHSLIFGVFGPMSLFIGILSFAYGLKIGALLALAAPLLNVLGIWQGFAARRYGTRAIGGLVLNGLGICFFIGTAFLLILIANALSHIN